LIHVSDGFVFTLWNYDSHGSVTRKQQLLFYDPGPDNTLEKSLFWCDIGTGTRQRVVSQRLWLEDITEIIVDSRADIFSLGNSYAVSEDK
jgi:hypothetical protein